MRVGKQVLFEKQREVREDGQTEHAAQRNILRQRRETLESECAPDDLQRILASHEPSCEGEDLDLCLQTVNGVRTVPELLFDVDRTAYNILHHVGWQQILQHAIQNRSELSMKTLVSGYHLIGECESQH